MTDQERAELRTLQAMMLRWQITLTRYARRMSDSQIIDMAAKLQTIVQEIELERAHLERITES